MGQLSSYALGIAVCMYPDLIGSLKLRKLDEFSHILFKALPHFDGAYVAEYSTGVEMWNESFDSHDTTGCQSYPSMRGQFGVGLRTIIPFHNLLIHYGLPNILSLQTNFARCQGLVMHDDADSSLAWVRHLALEMLLSAPSFVAAARSAALQNLEMAAQIDPLIESLKHADRITCLNSSTGSARRYRRTVTTNAMNTSVSASSVMTTATTSRRGGGGGNGLRRTASNIAPQRSSEVEHLAKLWADFYVSEVAEFSITVSSFICLYLPSLSRFLSFPISRKRRDGGFIFFKHKVPPKLHESLLFQRSTKLFCINLIIF